MMATMHSISSKADEASFERSSKGRSRARGEPVKALLDTGSPVTIVSLEFFLQAWARRKPQYQSLQEWKPQG